VRKENEFYKSKQCCSYYKNKEMTTKSLNQRYGVTK